MIEVRCQGCNRLLLKTKKLDGAAQIKCSNTDCKMMNNIYFTTGTNDMKFEINERVVYTGQG